MMIEEKHPKNSAPNTDSHAKPIRWEMAPNNRKVIEVKNAMYRNANLSGKFLVSESKKAYGTNKNGHKTIEVECYWYGWKPKTRWVQLTLINQEIEITDYSNLEVIKDIGR